MFEVLDELDDVRVFARHWNPHFNRIQSVVRRIVDGVIDTGLLHACAGCDFIKFRKEIQNAMPSLVSSLELDPEAESTIMSFDVSNVFHRQLNSILALAWFRTRHPKERTRILSMKPTSFYGTKDAHNAFELLESIPELKSRQFRLGMIAASALHFFNSKDACLLIYNECLHLPDISEEDIATANENIGIIHRENGHYKLMVRFMRKALDSYRKSGNVYRECVCLKNLGEAVYALGFEEAGLKHLQESDARGLALPDPRDRFGVQYNLAESWRRLKNRGQELVHLNKCFKIVKESEIEIPEDQLFYINQRINQLE